ncbi:hypothetical protein ZEAMMB73_Zm00001d032052 [Zea mays]|uniref:Uncharacterized protein n=1 Tax=Zea mays TaxID=4577 RepID=A0A1D6KNA7_MAIZE|nr:hypothetical protein ZEAMMB73_Zm00001d032052 [Zea mays]
MEAITESRMLYLFRSQPFWRMNEHRERVREEADTAGTCPSQWRCSGDGDRHWHGEAAKPTAAEPHPEEGWIRIKTITGWEFEPLSDLDSNY